MNQLKVTQQNQVSEFVFIKGNEVVTDSLTVSKVFGKEHKNVIRDIEVQLNKLNEASEQEWGQLNFERTQYQHSQNKQWYDKYNLTEDAFAIVAMSYITPEAMKMKVKFLNEFKRMKDFIKQQQQPNSPLQALQMAINQMVLQEQKMVQLEQQVTTVQNRINNLDTIDTNGDQQQQLNKMIQRLAWDEGVNFSEAWKMFRNAFNTAYRTNLKAKVNNYKEKHGLTKLTVPQYLSLTNQLSDALRVADKLLNKGSATA